VPADSALWQPVWNAGRGFRKDEEHAVVLNSRFAARLPDVSIGSQLELEIGPARDTWTVVGIAREPFAGPVAYVPRSYFERAGHGSAVNSLRLALDRSDADSIRRVRAELERNLELEGVKIASSATKAERRRSFDEHAEMIYVFLVIVACVFALVGALGLATTMSLNVLERRREMGVLRTIGATPRIVSAIVVAEGAAIAGMSWALAVFVAWPLSQLVGNALVQLMLKSDLVFVFESFGLVSWLAISVVLGVLASALPAWHAGRRPIREALSFE
jgi:putative ABC transport system permease protein